MNWPRSGPFRQPHRLMSPVPDEEPLVSEPMPDEPLGVSTPVLDEELLALLVPDGVGVGVEGPRSWLIELLPATLCTRAWAGRMSVVACAAATPAITTAALLAVAIRSMRALLRGCSINPIGLPPCSRIQECTGDPMPIDYSP